MTAATAVLGAAVTGALAASDLLTGASSEASFYAVVTVALACVGAAVLVGRGTDHGRG